MSTSDTLALYCSVGILDVPQELQTCGTYILVADYAAGLVIVNVRDPWFSSYESEFRTGSLVRDVCAFGEHALLACDIGGFEILDITNPLVPFLVGTCDTPGQALSVAADGRYAYVADGAPGGIQVINILDFQDPYIVGHYPTPDVALSVVASGYAVYVAAGMAGLLILQFGSSASLNL